PVVRRMDEMSRLWAAIQSHSRPPAAYLVSVVLIEATRPARTPLPVLSRGPVDPITQRDRGVVVNPDMLPPLPTLFAAAPPAQQVVAKLGDVVTVSGVRLAGTGTVAVLAHRLVAAPIGMRGRPHAARTQVRLR